MSKLEQRDGLWWPADDDIAYPLLRDEVTQLDIPIDACRHRRVVVQAGGNCGIYPLYLATRFDAVITFEPDPVNYECLLRNTRNIDNITAYHEALGDEPGEIGIKHLGYNNGASFVVPGEEQTQVALDTLGLPLLDLLQLDVEGYEIKVLQGAKETIMRTRPVIMVEDRGHSERYGSPRGSTVRYVEDTFGYRCIDDNGYDFVLVSHGDNKLRDAEDRAR